MKAMLKVLGVVALMATCNAGFVEFKEEGFNTYNKWNNENSKKTAQVINADDKFEFWMMKDEDENSNDMYAKAVPSTSSGKHEICGNNLGFQIENDRTYCNVRCLHFELNGFIIPEDWTNMLATNMQNCILEFKITFKSTEPQINLVQIPVFQIPSEVNSLKLADLKKWADENKVGLLSSADVKEITAASPDKDLSINFKWLRDLMKYGVFESSQVEYNVLTFVARPIVLSATHMEQFKKWINTA